MKWDHESGLYFQACGTGKLWYDCKYRSTSILFLTLSNFPANKVPHCFKRLKDIKVWIEKQGNTWHTQYNKRKINNNVSLINFHRIRTHNRIGLECTCMFRRTFTLMYQLDMLHLTFSNTWLLFFYIYCTNIHLHKLILRTNELTCYKVLQITMHVIQCN